MTKLKFLLLAIIAGLVIGFAFYGWSNLYAKYLETSAPVIVFGDGQPRGIGLTPVTVHLELSDWGAGLDEVVARVHQRGLTKEVLRQALKGQPRTTVSFEIAGERLGLDEGEVTLEIRAFDRSFWSNSSQKTLELRVDYRKPRLEVVSVMHNTRRGGAQLLIYKAIDESLALSGVKVGSQTFIGFPASGLDEEFEDRSLFAVLYSVPVKEGEDPEMRVFAQDAVGNGNSTNFSYRLLSRSTRQLSVKVGNDFLRGPVTMTADGAFPRLKALARASGEPFGYRSVSGSDGELYEKLMLVLNRVVPLSDRDLAGQISKQNRLERSWRAPFLQPNGVALSGFGDQVTYRGDWVDSPSVIQTGFEFQISRQNPAVYAAADGVVSFVGEIGSYGRLVVLDHGLGLSSVYARLDTVSVREGNAINAGEEIGKAGRSGLSRTLNLFFEVRVQGVATDPREWWDRSWFEGHINDAIANAKRSLGITAAVPLE